MIKVAVLGGGPSNEHEVSLKSAAKVVAALDPGSYEILAITISRDRRWHCDGRDLSEAEALEWLKRQGVEVVFIALHGSFGEDGAVQQLLDSAGLCYTGSSSESSSLAMDKTSALNIFRQAGLKTPVGTTISKDQLAQNDFAVPELPLFIKPARGGSSIGASIVKKPGQLHNALVLACEESEAALVEQYIKGREVTCGVLDDGSPIAMVPTEIQPKRASFFDFISKYQPGATEETTPAKFSKDIIVKIQDIALKAHQALGCYGMSRSDMIIRGDEIFILETNVIPGLTETSLLPQGAAAMGLNYSQLIDKIIRAAVKRCQGQDNQ